MRRGDVDELGGALDPGRFDDESVHRPLHGGAVHHHLKPWSASVNEGVAVARRARRHGHDLAVQGFQSVEIITRQDEWRRFVEELAATNAPTATTASRSLSTIAFGAVPLSTSSSTICDAVQLPVPTEWPGCYR